MAEKEFPGNLQEKAELLADESRMLLEKDMPGFEGREELEERARQLVFKIRCPFKQTRGALWEPYIDVVANAAALFLRHGWVQEAERISTEAISNLTKEGVGTGGKISYSRLYQDPLLGARLLGVWLHARRSQGEELIPYASVYRKLYKRLEWADRKELQEFLSKITEGL